MEDVKYHAVPSIIHDAFIDQAISIANIARDETLCEGVVLRGKAWRDILKTFRGKYPGILVGVVTETKGENKAKKKNLYCFLDMILQLEATFLNYIPPSNI